MQPIRDNNPQDEPTENLVCKRGMTSAPRKENP